MQRTTYIIIFLTAIVVGTVGGGLINKDFEILDDPSHSANFNTPFAWDIYNHAAAMEHFVPAPGPRDESDKNWYPPILANGLDPHWGQHFALLSTGDAGTDSSLKQAWMSQQINSSPNEVIFGQFFFGTFDYGSYYDYATINLIKVNDPNDTIPILIVGIDTSHNPGVDNYPTKINVGNHGSTDGWQQFEYLFTEDTAGLYTLKFEIFDVADVIYRSYLAVDNISICVRPEYGDINLDCEVNMLDFIMLASDWLCDCSDPGNLPDPNDCSWTNLGGGNIQVDLPGDIDCDNAVNLSDLNLMSEFWLFDE